MISMTRQQQGDFNRCCDFLARMIECFLQALFAESCKIKM